MRRPGRITKRSRISTRMLCSYLVIILAPAVAILVIYAVMQGALLDIQKEKAQNLSMETAVTFNKEIEQLSNIAKYIAADEKLKSYLSQRGAGSTSQEYFRAYELAKSYPDYALLNSLIGEIYIMPRQTSYLIQVPHVVPNNALGMSVLDINAGDTGYQELVESLYGLERSGVICGEEAGMPKAFRIVQHFDFTGNGELAGVVVIELDWKEIKNLLAKSLWTETGMAFLVDDQGEILYVYDSCNGRNTAVPDESSWREYLKKNGWSGDEVVINQVSVDVNHWSLVTAMPRQELLLQIASGRYAILALCIWSLLTGVAICLWYWNRNQAVVDQYLRFTEKYPEQEQAGKESTNMWKNFGEVIEHAENLQIVLERQRERLREEIVRKMLCGIYDSEEELKRELLEAGLELPVQFPCVLAGLQPDDSMLREAGVSVKEFEAVLTESLSGTLPCPYFGVGMGSSGYVLLICAGEEPDGQRLRQLLEAVNYAIYSRIPVTIYTGISDPADSVLSLAGEYEHICRACEYARYYKLRIPCLIGDLPGHQHVVFTVELEIQLEKTIRNGSREQLEAVVAQVQRNYFYLSREGQCGGGMPASYNLEVLRCILLRCLGDEEKEAKRESLLGEIHAARTPQEMEEVIRHVWQHFETRRILCQDQELERLKVEAEAHIGRGFSNAEYNLAMLAEQLGVPEKKLYRDFKKMYGVSFSSYLEMRRISHAQKILKEGRPVTEVAQAAGYGSDYSFRRAFKRVVGVAPSDYQKMQQRAMERE